MTRQVMLMTAQKHLDVARDCQYDSLMTDQATNKQRNSQFSFSPNKEGAAILKLRVVVVPFEFPT